MMNETNHKVGWFCMSQSWRGPSKMMFLRSFEMANFLPMWWYDYEGKEGRESTYTRYMINFLLRSKIWHCALSTSDHNNHKSWLHHGHNNKRTGHDTNGNIISTTFIGTASRSRSQVRMSTRCKSSYFKQKRYTYHNKIIQNLQSIFLFPFSFFIHHSPNNTLQSDSFFHHHLILLLQLLGCRTHQSNDVTHSTRR